jgi:hypothetical protein
VTKSTAERLLEKAAKNGSATAAVELARVRARKDREKRKPNITQLRAQDRDAKRQATSTSRSTSIVGPDTPEGYAERVLASLLGVDPDPELTAQVDAEREALRAAYAAEPDYLDRSPAEVARQKAMDEQMRDVADWFTRSCARRDAGEPDPFNDHRSKETQP